MRTAPPPRPVRAPVRAWRSPSAALAAALLVAPVAAVFQSKALAPIGLAALAAAVIAHRRERGAWPRPGGPALAAALALAAWGALSAAWAPDAARALHAALSVGGLALLAAAAGAAAAADDAADRRLLPPALAAGVGAGLVLATLDAATGHALRAAVRGLERAPPELAFGLKPAAAFLALLLPLLVALPAGRRVRGGLMASGLAVVALLPGDTARLAALAGLGAAGLAHLAPRAAPRLLGAALAGALVLTPLVLGLALRGDVAAGHLPPSAAHRLLIWDFVLGRAAERPGTGWGMEASRAVPGGEAPPTAAALRRFGLDGPERAGWFARPGVQVLPLHPHNGALQLWLELGIPGAALGALLAWRLALAAGGAPCPPAALGALAAASVTGLLSFGTWQGWWMAAQALAAAALAGLPAAAGAGSQRARAMQNSTIPASARRGGPSGKPSRAASAASP